MELTRRNFLSRSAEVALAGFVMPGLESLVMANEAAADLGALTVPAGKQYPGVPFGVQAGEVNGGSAVIWSATDRPGAQMVVQYSTRSDFKDATTVKGPRSIERNGYATSVVLDDLPRGEQIFYRVSYNSGDSKSPSLVGTFKTPATVHQEMNIILSGDTAGQGYGINPDIGGMPLYRVMASHAPDVFVHLGDNIYADGPIPQEMTLADGRLWKNVVTEQTGKVAETLPEFIANWQYNLLDVNVLRFNRTIPVISCWDDHEVKNNFDLQQAIEDDRYQTVRDMKTLAANGRDAYLAWTPVQPGKHGESFKQFSFGPTAEIIRLDLRSYREANTPILDRASPILGRDQTAWFKQALKTSTATWKLIACDMPIGLVVPDGDGVDAIANGDGKVRGREHEIADILRFIKHEGVQNVVFFTADVHYAAAHRYNPDVAVFQDFNPFYEFVSGPIHAVTGSQKKLDNTFGIEIEYASRAAGSEDLSPLDGAQYFTKVHIDAEQVLTVELRDLADRVLYTKQLTPSA